MEGAGSSSLAGRTCTPCTKGADLQPVSEEEAASLAASLPLWTLDFSGTPCITRRLVCKNFKAAMAFVNGMAVVAEEQGHHPDFTLTNYREVVVTMTTHDIQGLHMNDFVVASNYKPQCGL